MRKKIIAGNWKMNLSYAQAMTLTDAIIEGTNDSMQTKIILAPPFVYLSQVELQSKMRTNIFIAAQNCSDKNSGAITGEVSAAMLQSIGVDGVIIGHSERRQFFNETDETLSEKINRALENNLEPIFCCGETIEQRKSGKHFDTVKYQLMKGLFHLGKEQITGCIIAYEPVWAIGTGVTATTEQAQEMHAFIRQLLNGKYGIETSDNISILYGGSVTASNASELFSCNDLDGGLVGGASLKANDFLSIIVSMEEKIK
jgi:triosephosphate isomerase